MTQAKKPTSKELQEQVQALTGALQHERADADNLRRRFEAQIAGLQHSAKASVVQQLLPALDNLERALKHVPANLKDDDYVKGVSGVVKQFEKILNDIGVQRIKTVGEVFDPHYHEAVSLEDGPGQTEVVSEELQPGYVLGDHIIRHAMVKVKMSERKGA